MEQWHLLKDGAGRLETYVCQVVSDWKAQRFSGQKAVLRAEMVLR